MKNIVFRVDASLEIGNGHVMRCLTLAETIKNKNNKVVFICRNHSGNLISYIESKGFSVFLLESDATTKRGYIANSNDIFHADWLGVDQLTDAYQCKKILEAEQVDWLIVDHYAIDYRWQDHLKSYCNKLMVIDDLADRVHHCDLLLDQTYGRKKQDYEDLVPHSCTLMLGVSYALLRPEFVEWRKYSLQRRAEIGLKRLLITMGGVDKDNITGRVLEVLKRCDLPNDMAIVVVMGQNAPHLGVIKQLAMDMPYVTDVRVGVNNMAELMAKADIAIGAAGATTWERFCLELPSIILALAENQLKAKTSFSALSIDLIDIRNDDFDTELCNQIKNVNSAEKRSFYKGLVDGMGSKRVYREMEKIIKSSIVLNCQNAGAIIIGLGELSLCALKEEDIEQVRQWRNSDRILKTTVSNNKITKEQQVAWFSRLGVKDYYFKIIFKNKFIGVASLKFNSDNNTYDPGVFIGDDEYEGAGIGFAAAVLLSLFGFECLNLETVTARILKTNFSAIRMNKQLGYVLSNEGSEFDEYLLSKKIFNSKKNKLVDLASRVV